MELKGKRVQIILKYNGYNFSGVVVDDSPQFLVLQDDRRGLIKGFAKDEIAGWTVLSDE